MNYYRRFPGDYARDTRHLSLEEHGAYTLLLDHTYATESPVASLEIAERICGAATKHQRIAVKFVLENFFTQSASGWRNKRAEEEIKYLESRSKAAKQSAEIRWHGNAVAMRAHSEGNALQTPDSRLPDKEKVKVFPPAKPAGVKATDEFSIFWEAYPKKLGKQEATRAWIKRGCEGRLGDILASLKAWRDVEWREREFIPYPATWLNADRWKETPVGQKGGIDERELERVRALRR